jgi:transcriptional regulator with XRE-family HTH domain
MVVRSSGVQVIRERTSLSQAEFAQLIGVSVKTLQNWEQERRRPTGPAAALLTIIDHDPALAVRAIHTGFKSAAWYCGTLLRSMSGPRGTAVQECESAC